MPDVPDLVARVKPSVVSITTEQDIQLPARDLRDPFGFFEDFFGRRGQPAEPDRHLRRRGLGSGILIDHGRVVTNAHVIAGADKVRVQLADGRELPARVKGRDERLDLAVLELEGDGDLPAATLGSSGALRVGEYVVAIGNPFGLGFTVTMGVVSAKGRVIGAGPYDDFIQTDASINPGNSGGPLFNLRGEVVGINTAINPQGQGIGFAIPVDALKQVLPELISTGHVERGRLGVVVQPVDAQIARAVGLDRPRGALIADIERGSPAEHAGLQPGDVVLAVDGAEVEGSRELPRVVSSKKPGSRVSLRVLRGGQEKTIDVTLGALEGGQSAAPAEDGAAPQDGLGVTLREEPGKGVVVYKVNPNGAAAGVLEPGDVVLEVGGHPAGGAQDVARRIAAAPQDRPLLLRIRRGDATIFVAIDRKAAAR
jgi:serine protease Do